MFELSKLSFDAKLDKRSNTARKVMKFVVLRSKIFLIPFILLNAHSVMNAG